jgi:hypothetical protein
MACYGDSFTFFYLIYNLMLVLEYLNSALNRVGTGSVEGVVTKYETSCLILQA